MLYSIIVHVGYTHKTHLIKPHRRCMHPLEDIMVRKFASLQTKFCSTQDNLTNLAMSFNFNSLGYTISNLRYRYQMVSSLFASQRNVLVLEALLHRRSTRQQRPKSDIQDDSQLDKVLLTTKVEKINRKPGTSITRKHILVRR